MHLEPASKSGFLAPSLSLEMPGFASHLESLIDPASYEVELTDLTEDEIEQWIRFGYSASALMSA